MCSLAEASFWVGFMGFERLEADMRNLGWVTKYNLGQEKALLVYFAGNIFALESPVFPLPL
jgi:hypothetical protein